jgi:hypothetical protein
MRGDLHRLGAVRSLLALSAFGALAASCSESSDPVALPVPRPEEQSALFVEQDPISHDELGIPEPAAAEADASADATPAPAPEPSSPQPVRAPRARAVAGASAVTPSPAAVTPSPAPESHPPLDVLLRTPLEPGPPKNPLVLGEPGEAPVAAGPPAGDLDRWKDRVRIERRSEPYGVSGPRQGTVSQTEAGVRVPVDDSISVNGGVRVDQREEPGAPQPERVSRPQVGVEIKF